MSQGDRQDSGSGGGNSSEGRWQGPQRVGGTRATIAQVTGVRLSDSRDSDAQATVTSQTIYTVQTAPLRASGWTRGDGGGDRGGRAMAGGVIQEATGRATKESVTQ
jgi:hypothetical protein